MGLIKTTPKWSGKRELTGGPVMHWSDTLDKQVSSGSLVYPFMSTSERSFGRRTCPDDSCAGINPQDLKTLHIRQEECRRTEDVSHCCYHVGSLFAVAGNFNFISTRYCQEHGYIRAGTIASFHNSHLISLNGYALELHFVMSRLVEALA